VVKEPQAASVTFPGLSGTTCWIMPSRNGLSFAAMTHHDLPFDCLAVGQQFAVDLPRELVMQLARAYIRENPGTGFGTRREDGKTTCIRMA